MAQEEATKVSKRAQRRAAEDSEHPEAEGAAEADAEAGEDAAQQPSWPDSTVPPAVCSMHDRSSHAPLAGTAAALVASWYSA